MKKINLLNNEEILDFLREMLDYDDIRRNCKYYLPVSYSIDENHLLICYETFEEGVEYDYFFINIQITSRNRGNKALLLCDVYDYIIEHF